MRRPDRAVLALSCFIVMIIATLGVRHVEAQGSGDSPRAVLEQYCFACHNDRARTGGLALDVLDLTQVSDDAHVWEEVVRKLRTGAMPPSRCLF